MRRFHFSPVLTPLLCARLQCWDTLSGLVVMLYALLVFWWYVSALVSTHTPSFRMHTCKACALLGRISDQGVRHAFRLAPAVLRKRAKTEEQVENTGSCRGIAGYIVRSVAFFFRSLALVVVDLLRLLKSLGSVILGIRCVHACTCCVSVGLGLRSCDETVDCAVLLMVAANRFTPRPAENNHKPFETANDFFFPPRLLMTFALRWAPCLLVVLLIVPSFRARNSRMVRGSRCSQQLPDAYCGPVLCHRH